MFAVVVFSTGDGDGDGDDDMKVSVSGYFLTDVSLSKPTDVSISLLGLQDADCVFFCSTHSASLARESSVLSNVTVATKTNGLSNKTFTLSIESTESVLYTFLTKSCLKCHFSDNGYFYTFCLRYDAKNSTLSGVSGGDVFHMNSFYKEINLGNFSENMSRMHLANPIFTYVAIASVSIVAVCLVCALVFLKYKSVR